MAVVGLSWVLATLLGALPFWLRGTYRGASVRHPADHHEWQVFDYNNLLWRHWRTKTGLSVDQDEALTALLEAGAKGLSAKDLETETGLPEPGRLLRSLANEDPDWRACLRFPDPEANPDRREANYRFRWIKMSLIDSLFESHPV